MSRWPWRPKVAAKPMGRSPIWTSALRPAAKPWSTCSRASTATSSATTAISGMAPDLTGYASREWLTAFISNPADERFYGDKNDRMPAFAPHPGDPANRLSPEDLAILVSWLRGEWYEPANKHAQMTWRTSRDATARARTGFIVIRPSAASIRLWLSPCLRNVGPVASCRIVTVSAPACRCQEHDALSRNAPRGGIASISARNTRDERTHVV